MIRFLKSLGFSQTRRRGSHRFFTHPDGRTATVPDHCGEDLGRGLNPTDTITQALRSYVATGQLPPLPGAAIAHG